MPFDFAQVVAPFRMQPGLLRISPGAAQLTPARAGGRHLFEKTAALASFAGQALLATPQFDASAVLCTLAAEAAANEPPAFVCESESTFAAPRLGWAVAEGSVRGDGAAAIGELLRSLPRSQRPTALLCLAFEEDFAVIDGAQATIPWLAVCLPSRWAPEDKVGRHFAEVHAPVADNARLVAASEQLARLVTGCERWERWVWTVTSDPRLRQHPAQSRIDWPAAGDAESIGTRAHFRHEHQTFIPIGDSGQAVFTIRVDSEPLARALVSRDAARRLHAALSSMTPAVLEYRGLAAVRDPLLAWIARRAAFLPETTP